LVNQLQGVEFEAVMTAMAGFNSDQPTSLFAQTRAGGWMVMGDAHPTLRWVALDSDKRTGSKEPVVVVHSSAGFAAQHIDRRDLETVGQALLSTAAEYLGSWLKTPAWLQVHRWRYGFVSRPLKSPVLSSSALPTLVGCGDWCNGGNAEGAIASGHQAAQLIARGLE
jgi:predicted NAD/FAD-dependent oxidoreductase